MMLPIFFAMVTDRLLSEVKQELPWTMIFVNKIRLRSRWTEESLYRYKCFSKDEMNEGKAEKIKTLTL